MDSELPYLYIDDECDFNVAILLLIIDNLALNIRKNYKLDFNKIQFFMYLIRNPSKINKVLEEAGKQQVLLNEKQTYTIESLSVNVDILHDRSKVKFLLKKLASIGLLDVVNDNKNGISYFLTNEGEKLASELCIGYFETIIQNLDNIKSLQSMSSTQLFSILNSVFKGNK
ncbi:MAG: hypothetical protein methR_P3592 [Methyloprofundus sp.]|nr:MAG: hypothetical protein methR_P3592 [Methyloprofundus sp.]